MSKYVQEVTDKTEVPELKKIGIKHDFPDIIRAVAQYFRVGKDELLKRKRATGEQRKLAIYLSKVLTGGKNVEVGKIFGITIQAVTNVVGDIERRLEEDGKLRKEIILAGTCSVPPLAGCAGSLPTGRQEGAQYEMRLPCREAPACLSRLDGMAGELHKEDQEKKNV